MEPGTRLLVVADDALDCALSQRLLSQVTDDKYLVTVASGGAEALDKLKSSDFDCVIFDYSIPDVDGLALLKKFRAFEPFLPIIMLTGQSRADIAAAALKLGANDYLEKSGIRQARLHAAIQAAIDKCKRARDAEQLVWRPLLIIDDSPNDPRSYRYLLENTSYRKRHIVEAATGEAGLHHLIDTAFDAILLDNSSPDIDGLEVLRQIRALRPCVPVILMTGQGNVSVAVAAMQSGANDYLVKSTVDPDLLDRAISASIIKSAIDIKDAEIREKTAALQQSEERHRFLADRLQAANERALLVIQAAGIGIWDRNVSTNEVSWDERMYLIHGLEPYSEPGSYALWVRHLHPDDRGAAVDAMQSLLLDQNQGFDTEFRIVWNDGSVHHLRARARGWLDPDRKVIGFVGINWDVTVKRRATEALHRTQAEMAVTHANLDRLARHLGKARDQAEQANQAKSRFLAGITHELRTPLHAILGHAQLLSMEGDLNPAQQECMDVMMASGQHLLEMINSVLDMSMIEAEQMELHLVSVDLTGLIRGCLDAARPAAKAKGLALNFAPFASLSVIADPVRLRQVLINLLGNAIKFTPAGSVEVRLSQAADETRIRLEVVDTGPGIKGIHRDKLFRTFERLNSKAVRGIEGAGLGLAIAARLVQLMNGNIGYADNPGGGSVFWLDLPTQNASAPVEVPTGLLAARVPGSCLRVLVVDDQALNRTIASKFLSQAGHQVICLNGGEAAVAAAETEDFDVILMDIQMPGMDGLEATRLIRALPGRHGQVPVLAVTAQAFAQQIELCTQAGMDGHVSKPFTQHVVLAAVETIAARPRGTHAGQRLVTISAMETKFESPVFDRETFDAITEFLPPAEMTEHLQTLVTRGEMLVGELRNSEEARDRGLVREAHIFGGSAGVFGFLAVVDATRAFEAQPEEGAMVDQLATAIEASLPIIRQQLAAATVTTA